jgi:hypothetical protein
LKSKAKTPANRNDSRKARNAEKIEYRNSNFRRNKIQARNVFRN